ncbi:MAG: hypothetical protein LBU89_13180 [Fibromonadaceae bacterium]|nr:hypothetical protein [Fibromonadaceae bacterium]
MDYKTPKLQPSQIARGLSRGVASFLIALALMAPGIVYSGFIINDKDGWTNIREKPDGKAKVLGKVHKHQVFFSTGCDDNLIYTDNWEPVTAADISGYIFKKNIIQISSFPVIASEYVWLEDEEKRFFTAQNDSITVTMKLTYNENRAVYHPYDIEEMVVKNGEKRTVIQPLMIVASHASFKLFIGDDGALYLQVHNGSDGEGRVAWYSIVNGKVVFSATSYTSC